MLICAETEWWLKRLSLAPKTALVWAELQYILSSQRKPLCLLSSAILRRVAKRAGSEVKRIFPHWPLCISKLDRIKAKIHQQKTQLSCLGSLNMNNSLQDSDHKTNPLIYDIYKRKPTAILISELYKCANADWVPLKLTISVLQRWK